eukprot:TRINITY_DN8626_c0_g1_i2.p1 TRINITY_DN8626_c0_g1~~TRINITY_DN8626_c0_g1_i2.p1  ORF type:complete len:318 (-),score=99.67 TRINITY_DN8626_c0_g1_i2:40-993(-)
MCIRDSGWAAQSDPAISAAIEQGWRSVSRAPPTTLPPKPLELQDLMARIDQHRRQPLRPSASAIATQHAAHESSAPAMAASSTARQLLPVPERLIATENSTADALSPACAERRPALSQSQVNRTLQTERDWYASRFKAAVLDKAVFEKESMLLMEEWLEDKAKTSSQQLMGTQQQLMSTQQSELTMAVAEHQLPMQGQVDLGRLEVSQTALLECQQVCERRVGCMQAEARLLNKQTQVLGHALKEQMELKNTAESTARAAQTALVMQEVELQEARAEAAMLRREIAQLRVCLLYTSDAADEEDSVDLGVRRIIKKKN